MLELPFGILKWEFKMNFMVAYGCILKYLETVKSMKIHRTVKMPQPWEREIQLKIVKSDDQHM